MVDDGWTVRKLQNSRNKCYLVILPSFHLLPICFLSGENCAKLSDVLVTSGSSLENYQDCNKTDGRTAGRTGRTTHRKRT